MYFNGFIYSLSVTALATAVTFQQDKSNSPTVDFVPNVLVQRNVFNLTSPPMECSSDCDGAYKRAFTCGLGEDIVLNRASNAAFDPQCLCNSGGFLQDAPGCIQCLFEHPDKDITHRSMLLAMIEACVDEYNVIPCPRYCAPIPSLITYCDGIDGAHKAGAPPPDPRYLPPPIGIAGVDNDTFPCICREGYKNMVDTCFNCVKKWEINRALKWQGTTKQCAPPKSKTSQRPTTSQGPRATKTQRPPASGIAQGDISGVLKDSTRTNAPSQLAVEASGGKYASVVPGFLLFSWLVGVFVAALILI